jgi:hypothetical protein
MLSKVTAIAISLTFVRAIFYFSSLLLCLTYERKERQKKMKVQQCSSGTTHLSAVLILSSRACVFMYFHRRAESEEITCKGETSVSDGELRRTIDHTARGKSVFFFSRHFECTHTQISSLVETVVYGSCARAITVRAGCLPEPVTLFEEFPS